MRSRPLLVLAERSLLAALVLYGGTLAASTLRPVALPVARAVAQGAGCAAAAARVAATERAFAAAAKATNVRDAFVAYIADSGAVLGGPGLSRRADIAQSPVRPGALLWGPEVVFASAAGDLGFSTGPSESYASAAPDARPSHGHFATIWAQQPDGSYRFLADIGTPHAAPAPGMIGVATLPTHAAPAADARCPDAPAVAPTDAVAAAAAADSIYAAEAARGWRAAARLHAADVRVHRGGRYPLVGRAARDSVAAWGDAALAAPRAALGVARSGDFAWTRGTYALGPADAPAETGAFLRVWRHDGAAWRLAVEVLSPARPPRPAPRDTTRRG
jgi:hypothetical protein